MNRLTKDEEASRAYPRIYRSVRSAKVMFNGLGVIFTIFALRPIYDFFFVTNRRIAAGDLLGFSLLAGFALRSFFFVDRRVILYEDAIEVETWFSKRKLNRTEISGYRMGRLAWQAGGGSYYIIVPLDSGKRELKLTPLFRSDKAFFAWMRTIQHLKS